MSDLRKLSNKISKRPGHAAAAVALILTASAAFAEGNKDKGRTLVEQALAVQARVYDEPQDDTVLTAAEREQLRKIASEMGKTPKTPDTIFTRAAAIDLLATAGMVSRRRADADASLRMVLAFNRDAPISKDERDSVFRDIGLPIRIGVPGKDNRNQIKFETL